VIDFRRTYLFPVPPAAVWSSIEDVQRFPQMWSWLGHFQVVGDGLKAGTVLEGTVSPPLPYRMRVQVTLDRCLRPERIEATVGGDLTGHALLTLAPVQAGSEVGVAWTIEMRQRAMRAVARVAYPLLRWGHDRVVETTVAGFRRQLGATTS
jgi:carbon monoxide dehydrogenase subunit G